MKAPSEAHHRFPGAGKQRQPPSDRAGTETEFQSSSWCPWGPDCCTVRLNLCTGSLQDERYNHKAVITLPMVLCTGQRVGGETERAS